MAILKCKMCGGNLEVIEGTTVCECDSCGTTQTLPKISNENVSSLFNRANTLRIKSEFDKAIEIYEKIITTDDSDAEAYWGLLLCKYGVEYVEDPATFKRIPTCHRTQMESIFTDVDYQAAIEKADTLQKSVYKAQAEEIDALQRDILKIVHNEKPFDVFICYKETDETGKRTVDSTLANDIYYQLTQQGFKVFFSAITLEDKLGQEYEPYIFAALNSAKVMLAIGTKPEYFTAVWVKNEWSRYLKLMKSDRSKTLIPCYKDMDAYDLPDEFSHLQAQDMGKIGFINDIVRGINKLIASNEETTKPHTVQQAVVQTSSTNVENLIKRGNLALEDGNWSEADKFFEQVLNENAEDYRGYLGKLMAKFGVHTESEFLTFSSDITDADYFKKSCRFADENMKEKFEKYRLQGIYNMAYNTLNTADNRKKCDEAYTIFEKISDYANSALKMVECKEKANQIDYERACEALKNANNKEKCAAACTIFESLNGYADSAQKMIECEEKGYKVEYNNARQILESAKSREKCYRARKMFEDLNGYADSKNKMIECVEKANLIDYNRALKLSESFSLSDIKKAANIYKSLGAYKDSIDRYEHCLSRISCAEKMSTNKHTINNSQQTNKNPLLIIVIAIIIVILIGIILGGI